MSKSYRVGLVVFFGALLFVGSAFLYTQVEAGGSGGDGGTGPGADCDAAVANANAEAEAAAVGVASQADADAAAAAAAACCGDSGSASGAGSAPGADGGGADYFYTDTSGGVGGWSETSGQSSGFQQNTNTSSGEVCSVSTSRGTVNRGGSSVLSWSCSKSTSAMGQNFSTGGSSVGSLSVSPDTTTQYVLQCLTGCQAVATVIVRNPILSITANPTRVRVGNESVISWSAEDVESCAVQGPGFSASGISGSRSTGSLSAQAVYSLSCETEAGSTVSASVQVTLLPSFDEI